MRTIKQYVVLMALSLLSFACLAQKKNRESKWTEGYKTTSVYFSLDPAFPGQPFEFTLHGGYSLGLSKVINEKIQLQMTLSNRFISHDFNQRLIDRTDKNLIIEGETYNREVLISASSKLFLPSIKAYAPFGLYFNVGAGYSRFKAAYPSIEEVSTSFDAFSRPGEKIKGTGYFFIIGLGRSYAITENIYFDLGADWNFGIYNADATLTYKYRLEDFMAEKNIFFAHYGISYFF